MVRGVASPNYVTDRAAISGWGFKPMQRRWVLCDEAHHPTHVIIRHSLLQNQEEAREVYPNGLDRAPLWLSRMLRRVSIHREPMNVHVVRIGILSR
jgi:hypothetical protein